MDYNSRSTFSFLNPDEAVGAAHMQEGQHVADFHAGAGFISRAAARAVGSSGRVWAIDARRDILARLKNTAELEGLSNIEIVRGNIERLGGTLLPDASLDMVLLVTALCTAENISGVIAEASRVLKKSGRMLVIDWKPATEGLGPHPSHVVSEETAIAALSEVGFVVGEPIPSGDYHWGRIARRG